MRPSRARTSPSFAPRLLSRIGSTRGCWRVFSYTRRRPCKIAACNCASLRRREQRVTPPPQPVGEKPNPFTRGDIDTAQALRDLVKGPRQIRLAARAVIDRPGLDVEASLAKGAHRARNVMGRGNQDPSFAGSEIALLDQHLFEEDRILVSVARRRFEDQSIFCDTHCGEERFCALSLAARLVKNTCVTACERDFRVREALRQDGPLDDPLRSLAYPSRMACRADHLGAAKDDEAWGRRRTVEIGPRETVLE